jgi:Fe-S cluster assembly protein SufD
MTKTTAKGTGAELFEAQYEALAGRLAQAPAWQRDLRRRSFERVAATGLPTRRMEGWRHLNLEPLRQMTFLAKAPAPSQEVVEAALARLGAPALDGSRLVFVNGRYWPSHSRVDALPEGTILCPMTEALADDARGRLEAFLGQAVSWNEHPLATLNAALFADGLFLELPPGAVLDRPIHVIHLSGGAVAAATASAPSTPMAIASHPRNLALIGAGARATLIEIHGALDDSAYLVNAVTEILVAENGALDYAKLQSESRQGIHFHALATRQQAGSRLRAGSLATGGRIGRDDVIALLDGEGCDATINGIYMLSGEQSLDTCTLLDHARPHCHSRQSYRGILGGQSRAAFRGKILVRPHAQKTDAVQSCKNLLLSGAARAGAQPELEIYADDVKCTHGATVGRLSEEALFYARTRGLSMAQARALLTQAFAAADLADVADAATRERMRGTIGDWLETNRLSEATS